MNAVSAGQWVRYQTGGGQTARSHTARINPITSVSRNPARSNRCIAPERSFREVE
jgi:hypothetical protein